MVITRPEYDDTTFYMCKWNEEVVNNCNSRDIKCIDLQGPRANLRELESVIKKNKPKLAILNGHGNEDTILGHNNEILIKSGENEDLLNHTIVYSIACNSAKKLGERCVDSGTDAYIGYEKEFIFLIDTSKTLTPLQDEVAKPFFESSNIVPLSLIKGNSVGEAYSKSQQTFEKNIDYFRTHYTLESMHIMFLLRWDKSIQKMRGKENSTI